MYLRRSVAESEEVPEMRNPSEGLLLRRLLEDLRSGQIKYRCADIRHPILTHGNLCQDRSNTGALTSVTLSPPTVTSAKTDQIQVR